MFKLSPVLVLTALQVIVVFWTCPMVISVSFLCTQPMVPPGTLPPSPSMMLILLVPVHDWIFPMIIGEPMQPPCLQYPLFPPVTPQLSPTVIGELRMYDLLWVITLGEWPYEYSQCDQVLPVLQCWVQGYFLFFQPLQISFRVLLAVTLVLWTFFQASLPIWSVLLVLWYQLLAPPWILES